MILNKGLLVRSMMWELQQSHPVHRPRHADLVCGFAPLLITFRHTLNVCWQLGGLWLECAFCQLQLLRASIWLGNIHLQKRISRGYLSVTPVS